MLHSPCWHRFSIFIWFFLLLMLTLPQAWLSPHCWDLPAHSGATLQASGFSPAPARVQRGSAPALGHSSTSWVPWSCWKCVPLPVGQASSLFPNPWAKDPALPGQGETQDVLLSFGFRLTRCDKVVSVSVWSGIPSAHSALWLSSLASTNVPDS